MVTHWFNLIRRQAKAHWSLTLPCSIIIILIYFIKAPEIKIAGLSSFHSIAEAFNIILSINIFTVFYSLKERNYSIHDQILGLGFLLIGLMDYFHIRTMMGMPVVFNTTNSYLSEYFWLMARFSASVMMLAIVFTDNNRPTKFKIIHFALPIVLLFAILYGLLIIKSYEYFPFYLKIAKDQYFFWNFCECLFSLIMYYCSLRFFEVAESYVDHQNDPQKLRIFNKYQNLSWATKFFSITNFAMMFYNFDYDLNDQLTATLAHITKAAGFIFIYRGLIKSTLVTPYLENQSMLLELDLKKKNLESMEKELQNTRKLATIGQHVDSIAHDIGNLLMIVSATNDQFLHSDDYVEVEKNVNQIHGVIAKCKDFLSSLIRFSKNYDRPLQKISMKEFFEELQLSIAPIVAIHKIELEFNVKDDAVLLMERNDLDQILFNLIFNAKDAIKPNAGKITVSSKLSKVCELNDVFGKPHATGLYYSISVTDTGKGIAKENFQAIFDPFYTGNENEKNHGLGLATIASVVNKYQGYIGLDSEIGEGTTFEICFPLDRKLITMQTILHTET